MTDSPVPECCLALGALEVYAGDECAGLRVAGWKSTKKLHSVFLLTAEILYTSIYSCILKCNSSSAFIIVAVNRNKVFLLLSFSTHSLHVTARAGHLQVNIFLRS
jgi:hypothetical protein